MFEIQYFIKDESGNIVCSGNEEQIQSEFSKMIAEGRLVTRGNRKVIMEEV